MHAVRELPENYRLYTRLAIEDSRTLLIMNGLGVLLLVLFGTFFFQWTLRLRPQIFADGLTFSFSLLKTLLALGVIAVVLVLHEGIHGLGFVLLARVRPTFAFKGAYAYAAAPGWYLPRGPYLWIGLAPFLLISLAGMAALLIAPLAWLPAIYLAVVFNATGAVGDLWVAYLLLRAPRTCLACDSGQEIQLFAPVG